MRIQGQTNIRPLPRLIKIRLLTLHALTWKRLNPSFVVRAAPTPQSGFRRLIVCVAVQTCILHKVSSCFHKYLLNFRWFVEVAPSRRSLNFERPKQGLPKQITSGSEGRNCVHLFHIEETDIFGVFWAFLVQFGLRIMHQEGKYEFWILGLFRSKITNWEGTEISELVTQNAPYLWCVVSVGCLNGSF